MRSVLYSAWIDANKDERFGFLAELDRMYGEGKGEEGRGLNLILASYLGKIKRIKEGNPLGNAKFCNRSA